MESQDIQKPKLYDCWSEWRKYYLSLPQEEFESEIMRYGYCGVYVSSGFFWTWDTPVKMLDYIEKIADIR